MLKRLLQRLGLERKPDVRHWYVTVYSREQCPCCEKAYTLLHKYRRRYRFTLDRIDVDRNPMLAERYGLEVPVVTIQGRVRFKGEVNPVFFEGILRSESQRF